jgi:hypothetical protein
MKRRRQKAKKKREEERQVNILSFCSPAKGYDTRESNPAPQLGRLMC